MVLCTFQPRLFDLWFFPSVKCLFTHSFYICFKIFILHPPPPHIRHLLCRMLLICARFLSVYDPSPSNIRFFFLQIDIWLLDWWMFVWYHTCNVFVCVFIKRCDNIMELVQIFHTRKCHCAYVQICMHTFRTWERQRENREIGCAYICTFVS